MIDLGASPSLPAHSCVTIGKLLNHSEPHFPYLLDGDDCRAYLIKQVMGRKGLATY